jgi:hypothetical protein
MNENNGRAPFERFPSYKINAGYDRLANSVEFQEEE